MTGKQVKQAARKTLKGHYALLVALCLIGALMGRGLSVSANLVKVARTGQVPTLQTAALPAGASSARLLVRLGQDGQEGCEALWERERELAGQGSGALSRSEGVLAGVMNKAQSGSYMADALAALADLTGSWSAGFMLLAVLWAAVVLLLWAFVRNIYLAAVGRLALEGRVYAQVPFGRVFFFLRRGRWGRAARTLFARSLGQLLWSLTIVGGVVKHCAWFPVPYLVAENPGMKPRRTLALAREMMEGHKWEFLRFELSFLGWGLLSLLTFGLSGALYSRPYRAAALGEYYAHIRAGWLALHPEDKGELDDPWLFERPDRARLERAYADLPGRWSEVESVPELAGFGGFVTRHFGILLRLGPRELAYAQAVEEAARLARLEREADGERYALRLSPREEGRAGQDGPAPHGIRCYWIWSFVAMFFVFCAAGWLWEVFHGYVGSGRLVNRGVLHGPWLPIYGNGACLILALLYPFRGRPGLHFLLAVSVSGVLEYLTGVWLELVNGGQRWWDYTGLFLNLQGRVCAEGLLLFGVSGCVVAYLLAPRLDRVLRRVDKRALIAVCVALLCLFAADQLRSVLEPNAGPGITTGAVGTQRPAG